MAMLSVEAWCTIEHVYEELLVRARRNVAQSLAEVEKQAQDEHGDGATVVADIGEYSSLAAHAAFALLIETMHALPAIAEAHHVSADECAVMQRVRDSVHTAIERALREGNAEVPDVFKRAFSTEPEPEP